MFVTELEIDISFRELQKENAPSPMFVTELGIDISFRELQKENA
jgi:hypothetical protein